jgi:ABC-type molybdate transport system substrate-binding protein
MPNDHAPRRSVLLLGVLAAVGIFATPASADGPLGADARSIFPPWQEGANNDAVRRGLEFTVPEIDNMPDFHGDLTDPKLVLYVGGNYFFAMAPLVAAFERLNPEYKGRLFWETIPPGLLVKQMEAGGVVTSGNMTFTAKPDVYFSGLKKVEELIGEGKLDRPAVPYVTNDLTIMIPSANPARITGLKDLAKPSVRLAMPNPEFEGVARQIKAALAKAGGETLADAVYGAKVKDGSALLTDIHHRQTPLFLMQGRVDAGVTWRSEAIFQEQAHHAISHVDIPDSENVTAIYAGASVSGCAHPDAAKAWLKFIASTSALEIFERYGFKAYDAKARSSPETP